MQLRIATKLVLLLLAASFLPLILFGTIAFRQVRTATELSVTEGNANVSRRAAEEIDHYVRNGVAVLKSGAENISNADLKPWQKERILKNQVNRFDEFNRLEIRDPDGVVVASSEVTPEEMSEREKKVFEEAKSGRTALSEVFIKDDLTPALDVAVPIRTLGDVSGVLVADLNLLQMWYLVDNIRIGKHGILHVLDPDERLIASGDGDRKKEVFQQRPFEPKGVLPEILNPTGALFANPSGVPVIAVGTRLPDPLRWSVIVEQPTSEAYALATRIGVLLGGAMAGMIVVAMALGLAGGRRNVVNPIRTLVEATRELASGNLDHRVNLRTGDEFGDLAAAFNRMAVRLKDLQTELILQERHAMFGRIASGLAHDLKHPIQAIENVSRLMDSMHGDAEIRQTFRRTVEREFSKINLFLENLHDLTHEVPLQPVPLPLEGVLRESVATFELAASKAGVAIRLDLPGEAETIRVKGDRNALNRVFSNLISNAIQAMPTGGRLDISLIAGPEWAEARFQDTGMGIPPERLPSLFDDFVTTKRRGLGLGLAIVRKIVQQHYGTIEVESRVNKGTCFTVRLPVDRR
ncbi:MAG TPA: sensor histidine kinase [bacterium]|nr:sensor histidine kinase [bacterium]